MVIKRWINGKVAIHAKHRINQSPVTYSIVFMYSNPFAILSNSETA